MSWIKVRDVEIGRGMPKICVPLVGKTFEQLMSEAKNLEELPFSIAEWRADYLQGDYKRERLEEISENLRILLKNKPLLVTFRTTLEGGEGSLEKESYVKLLNAFLELKEADLVDIELSAGDDVVTELIYKAKEHGKKVILSSHDFQKTPEKEVIIQKLCHMEALGGDIAKIAVMPNCFRDVLMLLEASNEKSRCAKGIPIVTMSMGEMGKISRVCGNLSGSAITFGAGEKASAPGQIEVRQLQKLLEEFCEGE